MAGQATVVSVHTCKIRSVMWTRPPMPVLRVMKRALEIERLYFTAVEAAEGKLSPLRRAHSRQWPGMGHCKNS
eukprot:1005242-Amphidinium_carterae.1